jgi:hypothetical protein
MTYAEMNARVVANLHAGKGAFYGFSAAELRDAQDAIEIEQRSSATRAKQEEARRIREAVPTLRVEPKCSVVSIERYGHKGGFSFSLIPYSTSYDALSVYLVSFDIGDKRISELRCLQRCGPMMGKAQLRLVALSALKEFGAPLPLDAVSRRYLNSILRSAGAFVSLRCPDLNEVPPGAHSAVPYAERVREIRLAALIEPTPTVDAHIVEHYNRGSGAPFLLMRIHHGGEDAFIAIFVAQDARRLFSLDYATEGDATDIYCVDIIGPAKSVVALSRDQVVRHVIHREIVVMEPASDVGDLYGGHWTLTPGHIDRMTHVAGIATRSAAARKSFPSGMTHSLLSRFISELTAERTYSAERNAINYGPRGSAFRDVEFVAEEVAMRDVPRAVYDGAMLPKRYRLLLKDIDSPDERRRIDYWVDDAMGRHTASRLLDP